MSAREIRKVNITYKMIRGKNIMYPIRWTQQEKGIA